MIPNKQICDPAAVLADGTPCQMRSVLDGENWCDTHQTYQWRKWEWLVWGKNYPALETCPVCGKWKPAGQPCPNCSK